MKIAIVTNLDNGVGLERDFQIVKRLAEADGHMVTGLHHAKAKPAARFDLVIFAETYVPGWDDLAPVRWAIPNPEWWFAEWNAALPGFARVLCKTRDTERIFSALGARTVFTGFESADRLDSSVGRERRFLHIAGESLLKGTQAVVECWEQFQIAHPLTVVSRKMKVRSKSKAVTVVSRLNEADMVALQNRCLFVIQPSHYEGYGHVLHEALSTGALIATTDASPMNELGDAAAALIPSVRTGEHGLAQLAIVDADGVRAAVEAMWDLPVDAVTDARAHARGAYEREVEEFRSAFVGLLRGVLAPAEPRPDPAQPEQTRLNPTAPRVAVVFPCHASGHELVRRSVMALRWQTADPSLFEVVIGADGGDPDGLLALAARQAARTDLPGRPFECRVVWSPRPRGEVPHRNHARNAGWRASRAPLCWMLDADFILPRHAIDHLLHEHDAAVAAGRPAAFSPCLAGVGAVGADAWLDRSALWAATGSLEAFAQAINCGPVSPAFGGYPDRYTGPGRPSSSLLGNLPEGMPVLWRGLLEALGGFDDKTFGEWGGDKEELVDRVKGCVRAGLFEIRLLSSVMALHQPHAADPQAFSAEAKPRQRERERRARLIETMATWWRPQIDRVKATIGTAIAAATPGGIVAAPAAPVPLAVVDEPAPPDILAAVLHQAQAKLKRERGQCSVVGRWSVSVARALAQIGVDAHSTDLASLERVAPGAVGQVVLLDVFAGLTTSAFGAAVDVLIRALTRNALVIAAERTKMGARPGAAGALRAPMEYQRALRGLSVSGQRSSGGDAYTLFSGRLV